MAPKKSEPAVPGAGQRVQMADIARLAGVSKATVSRALNHSHLVNAQTRSRILALASSLKYTINIGAQNLRLKQNRTVGVVIPFDSDARQHLSDPFFLSMLGALADALTARGFDMLLSRVDAEQIDCAAQPFDTGRVLGIILIGQWRQHEQLNALAARQVPIVVWGAQLPQQLYTTVDGDNVSGGMLAAAHLVEQGRRRIAFFGDINLPESGAALPRLLQCAQRARLAGRPAAARVGAVRIRRRRPGGARNGAPRAGLRCHLRLQRPAGHDRH